MSCVCGWGVCVGGFSECGGCGRVCVSGFSECVGGKRL